MTEYVYSFFLWPFQVCIETFYIVLMRVLKDNAGLAIMLSSIAMGFLLIPFYNFGKKNAPKKKTVLTADSGGIGKIGTLTTYLKPYFFVLLFSLLFFGANVCFKNLALSHTSFFIIKDLGMQDQLVRLGPVIINLLPLLMLVLVLVFHVILPLLDEVGKYSPPQIVSFIFFILLCIVLYNASSGLVLFWIGYVFFLCCRSLLVRIRYSSLIIRCLILAACAAFVVLVVKRFWGDNYSYICIAAFIAVIAAAITLKIDSLKKLLESRVFLQAGRTLPVLYGSSCAILFMLMGLVIPLLLFGSSPLEFDHIGPMLSRTILQSSSVFLLGGFLYWSYSPVLFRRFLSVFLPFLVILSFVCCFALPGKYGIITTGFVFEDWSKVDMSMDLPISIIAFTASAAAIFFVFRFNKVRLLKDIFLILIISLTVVSGINAFSIGREYGQLKSRDNTESAAALLNEGKGIFNFSRTGENIFILFLDRASGFGLPYIMKLIPSLDTSLDGFTWYPNTISFGTNTLFGMPAMMGGYEYRPLQINERSEIPLVEKINESLKVLPGIFGGADYNVSITDPSYANLSSVPDVNIFKGMKNVEARNIKGIFSDRFTREQSIQNDTRINNIDFDVMMRFAFFRISLPVVRPVIYNGGGWIKFVGSSNYNAAVKNYPNLLYLKDLCGIDTGGSNLNIMANETIHSQGSHTRGLELVFRPIVYTRDEISEYGSRENAAYIYSYAASLKTICSWIEWLKTEDIYDNTKIIIVGDHGRYFNGATIPFGAEPYNPLLLVKDFNSRGIMTVSDEFMTNADVPVIAGESLGKLTNPYTGKVMDSSPKDKEIFVNSGPWDPDDQKKNSLLIENTIEVKGRNIFDPKNWVEVNK